jgi:hypothetical protein
MTDCNATLTTATVGPCRCDLTIGSPDYLNHDPVSLFNEDRGEYEHVTLYTMTCKDHPDTGAGEAFNSTDHRHQHEYGDWYDDTPGATPHVDPVPWVTDAEVLAAQAALQFRRPDGFVGSGWIVTEILEAAAKARQETEGVTP